MSIARWNLKEAAGKTLARRTETASEAVASDEKADIFKVQYLYGRRGRTCGGHKGEGGCALPGEIWAVAIVLPASRGAGMSAQKSAEVIVGPSTGLKDRTCNMGQEPEFR